MFLHLLQTVKGLVYFTIAFKAERYGHDAHRQDVECFGFTGYHWSCACTRTTTHTSCDKHHLSAVVEHITYAFDAFLGRCTGTGRAITGTETLLPQLQVGWYRRTIESLVVCIAHNKRHIVNALVVHVVNGIAATTAHTNHFDDG